MADTERAGSSVLRSKRDATRYQILVEIAERQPAVSQQEIADAIGITAQAVSDYLRGLVEEGFVEKGGRGRYEVSKEGVDWLIGRTDELRTFTAHVAEDVIGQVEIETALATDAIEDGRTVSLSMADGVLRATPGEAGAATAVAITGADEGQDVGITDVEGVLDYELGRVTIVSLPRVHEGGSSVADSEPLREYAAAHDLVATAGTEAVAAARAAGLDPEIRFGTPDAIREAATKGLDVLLLATEDRLAAHTEALREGTVGYEMVEAADR
ncbi:MarR family protein [Halalkalicoccus paucihalophilus]|uniref:MarR family protein n=1 Tax=Halalkalicoccus paucihalophilus TaxID=1008153 RepID=A0A151AHU8_9EURY|nr:MarR family transcriptional regulator [Halalkalicoccus paucihalophilus]KYH26997.1 MarR family protein [Halalkalicoccus paucihalophilus]